MKENLRLGLILFIITAAAGILLGMAHEVTKEPIAKQELLAGSALDEVLPMAREPRKADVDIPEGSLVKEVNEGYDGNKLVGYTIRLAAKGFHGPIDMVVGISNGGKIEGVKIISHTETPGLGANIDKEKFKSQFKGKSIEHPVEVVKDGAADDSQIDAVSGATISSTAVVNGVNAAIDFYSTCLSSKGGQK